MVLLAGKKKGVRAGLRTTRLNLGTTGVPHLVQEERLRLLHPE